MTRFVIAVAVVALAAVCFGASAKSNIKISRSTDEIADRLTQYIAWVESVTGVHTGASNDTIAAISAAFAGDNGDKFVNSVDALNTQLAKKRSIEAKAKADFEKRGPKLHNEDLVEPPYARGDAFVIATAPGSLLIIDYDGDGDLAEETGDWEAEAVLKVVIEVLKAVQIPLDYLCDGDAQFGIACIPAGAGAILVYASELIDRSISFQDGMVHASLQSSIWLNTNIIHDAVKCHVAAGPRRYQSCNGADDNCDLNIDECDEDTYAPDVTINRHALAGIWFPTAAEAIAAVDNAVSSMDDCQGHSQTSASLSGTCANTVASITATDDCGNAATVTVPISLDFTKPVITCSLTTTTLGYNKALVNVGFSFTATDDCGTPSVEVVVMSDEAPIEQDATGGQFFPDAHIMRDINGVYKGLMVRAERMGSLDGRVYQISAIATDKAGNWAKCTSTVKVPASSKPPVDNGQFYTVARSSEKAIPTCGAY